MSTKISPNWNLSKETPNSHQNRLHDLVCGLVASGHFTIPPDDPRLGRLSGEAQIVRFAEHSEYSAVVQAAEVLYQEIHKLSRAVEPPKD